MRRHGQEIRKEGAWTAGSLFRVRPSSRWSSEGWTIFRRYAARRSAPCEQAADLAALESRARGRARQEGQRHRPDEDAGRAGARAAQGVRRAGEPAQGRDRGRARRRARRRSARRRWPPSSATRGSMSPCRRGPSARARIHPVSQVMDELAEIFADLGFPVAEGPDIEDDWHNFTALNIPPDHPARQMQDTFYLPAARRRHADGAAHPHLAGADPHHARRSKPPLRDHRAGPHLPLDSDATHTPMFHQVEGLVIDRDNPHGPSQVDCLDRFLPRLLRARRHAAALPPVLLPVHRAVGRGRHRLLDGERRAA